VNKLTQELNRRPWWLNLLWIFCLYMTFIYMPFDMFSKPYASWEEVWFGYKLIGWPAKLTEPLHWLIYGAGSYGIWKMKAWMWPWGALYCGQVMIAMMVYGFVNGDGNRPYVGLLVALVFAIPTVALWRSRPLFKA